MNDKIKIGFFGGTFDPPHKAHISLAKTFIEKYKLDKLYICPDNIPYHKISDISDVTLPEHRLNMCKLAFGPIGDKVIVSDMEITRGGNTYTYDTVCEILKLEPNCDRVFVLCGTDMINSLSTWKNIDKLTELATFVHASRAGVVQNEKKSGCIRGHKIEHLDFNPILASSTEIRENGENPSELVSDEVRDYISSNLLYHKDKLYDLEKINSYAKEHEKESRYIHTLGVVECAKEMRNEFALQLTENSVAAAALIHDITKYLSAEEHKEIFNSAASDLSEEDLRIEKIYHSRSGAILARKLFDVSDAVYNSIWNHTTGNSNMTVLDKIIFLADFIEKNRDYVDCIVLRDYYNSEIVKSKNLGEKLIALDKAMKYAFELTFKELEGKEIHTNTSQAYQSILKELTLYEKYFSI